MTTYSVELQNTGSLGMWSMDYVTDICGEVRIDNFMDFVYDNDLRDPEGGVEVTVTSDSGKSFAFRTDKPNLVSLAARGVK